jgi:hypothetical protein
LSGVCRTDDAFTVDVCRLTQDAGAPNTHAEALLTLIFLCGYHYYPNHVHKFLHTTPRHTSKLTNPVGFWSRLACSQALVMARATGTCPSEQLTQVVFMAFLAMITTLHTLIILETTQRDCVGVNSNDIRTHPRTNEQRSHNKTGMSNGRGGSCTCFRPVSTRR